MFYFSLKLCSYYFCDIQKEWSQTQIDYNLDNVHKYTRQLYGSQYRYTNFNKQSLDKTIACHPYLYVMEDKSVGDVEMKIKPL